MDVYYIFYNFAYAAFMVMPEPALQMRPVSLLFKVLHYLFY
jgi:hypothetical protein